VTLLAETAAHLRARDIPFALVGAGALAVHGVARSTLDLDLLVTTPACLSAPFWDDLRPARTRASEVEDAGGPQDAWDVTQLLAGDDRAALVAAVERALPALPAECAALWRRLRDAV
jgi:hypothetical protein